MIHFLQLSQLTISQIFIFFFQITAFIKIKWKDSSKTQNYKYMKKRQVNSRRINVFREKGTIIVFTRKSNWRPLCIEMEGSLLDSYPRLVVDESL
jgi:hypothetical protein